MNKDIYLIGEAYKNQILEASKGKQGSGKPKPKTTPTSKKPPTNSKAAAAAAFHQSMSKEWEGPSEEEKEFDDLLDMVEFELFSAYETFNKKHSKSVYTIFHSSILFEREWHKSMDLNINVFSTKNERQLRCSKKTGLEEYQVKQLIATEYDDLVKNTLSKFVIHNYPSAAIPFGDICEQVNKIDQDIIDDYVLKQQSEQFF